VFTLRPATAVDFPAIRKLIWQVGINPIGLNWQRFVLAVDEEGRMLGCGQIKPHREGTRELASIAVIQEARGLGIARAIITHLMQAEQPPLYLTCRPALQTLYARFGYHTLGLAEYPTCFRRLDRLARFLLSFRSDHESFSLMRWDGEKNDQ
jgi:N-acetylglutamate synthase-like GNAT family acetyltransferase